MVEPARADPLGLARDALEVEVEPRDDAKARRVVGRGGAAHAVHAHALKCKIEASLRRLRHESPAGDFTPEPITELTGPMQVHARVESDDAEQLVGHAVAHRETRRPTRIPVERARLGVAHARFGRRVEGHPRQPALEVPARTLDGFPELGAVAHVDRDEHGAAARRRGAAELRAGQKREALRWLFQAERRAFRFGLLHGHSALRANSSKCPASKSRQARSHSPVFEPRARAGCGCRPLTRLTTLGKPTPSRPSGASFKRASSYHAVAIPLSSPTTAGRAPLSAKSRCQSGCGLPRSRKATFAPPFSSSQPTRQPSFSHATRGCGTRPTVFATDRSVPTTISAGCAPRLPGRGAASMDLPRSSSASGTLRSSTWAC